jgi:hypothetical protein
MGIFVGNLVREATDVDVLCSTILAQSPSATARPRRSSLVQTLTQGRQSLDAILRFHCSMAPSGA